MLSYMLVAETAQVGTRIFHKTNGIRPCGLQWVHADLLVRFLHYNGGMQYPQMLVYETDGLLAAMLRETAKARRWTLREPRKPDSCLRLLRSICPSVLVLKIATYAPRPALSGTDSKSVLQEEVPQASVGRISNPSYREKQQVDSLELLADVHERFPDAAAVVVGDAEDLALTNLAWDLGASYVLAPPQSRQMLPEIVVGLMQEAIDKCQSSQ